MSLLDNAKSLRSNQTDTEQRLWYHLRAHRFMDLKFKRQKPLGRYVVDFVCLEAKLVIELDGGQHMEQVGYDRVRDAWLKSQGFTVLRFWNNQLVNEMEAVLERIRSVVESSTLSPSPSDYATSHSTKPASGQVAGYPTSVRGEAHSE